MKLNRLIASISCALSIAILAGCSGGCKSHLETGGAYAPGVLSTNAMTGAITTNATGAPDLPLYVADAAYHAAYDLVDGAFKIEYQNRAQFKKDFPQVKPLLDQIRPVALDIDRRWANARQDYLLNPTPAGLDDLHLILADIEKLVPTVKAALTSTK